MTITQQSFITIPDNPVPEGAKCYMLETPDECKLRVATFPARPDVKERGSFMVCTGRSEFIEKYFEIAEGLSVRGFNCVVMDWRGQGLSSRLLPIAEKGHITTFETFTADLHFVMDEVMLKTFPKGPKFILTHSMGSVPALDLMGNGYNEFEAAVLCAPMTRLFKSTMKRIFARIVARSAVFLNMSRQSIAGTKESSMDFEDNILTSDRARHDKFRALQAAAPNATIGAPTYGWLKAATDAMDNVHNMRLMSNLNTPILIISAGKDKLIDIRDHQWFAKTYKTIECVTIKDSLHEIMMERNQYRDQFWANFDNFIDRFATKSS